MAVVSGGEMVQVSGQRVGRLCHRNSEFGIVIGRVKPIRIRNSHLDGASCVGVDQPYHVDIMKRRITMDIEATKVRESDRHALSLSAVLRLRRLVGAPCNQPEPKRTEKAA
jgi:hypothetical protein